jgi:hypothetical protein
MVGLAAEQVRRLALHSAKPRGRALIAVAYADAQVGWPRCSVMIRDAAHRWLSPLGR